MKYIIKNIKAFIRTEKMIFALVAVCIIASSFIINFSYGLYQNYNVVKDEAESELTELTVTINNSGAVTRERFEKLALSIPQEINDNIEMYYAPVVCDDFYEEKGWGRLEVRFTVRDGNIYPCKIFSENLEKNGNLVSGEYFTPEQEMNGECVALASLDVGITSDENCTDYITSRVEDGERWLNILGKEYKVVGYHQQMSVPYFPFKSLEPDTQFNGFIFLQFEKPFSRSDYEEIKADFLTAFGDGVTFPELDIPESENYYLYNTIILISIMIAVLAAINFAVLYRYILSKRIKVLAVFRICGMTKGRALLTFLSECMMIAIPVYIVTVLVYDRLVLPALAMHYEYIKAAYSPLLYMVIFGIYAVSSAAVLFLMINFSILKKTICEAIV